MMGLRTYLVVQLLGCCFGYVAAVCVSQNCTIRNCTQNPRSGIDEDVFYCSISGREGCAKLKEKFQDQRVSSSEESPPLLMRLALYVHKHHAALNLTFLIHSGLGNDLPANEGVTLEFWSNDDPEYNNTCNAFNFSPQRVTPAIPARDITYCGIMGLYEGTEQKRETLYFLKLTAVPSESSITYHLLYQGWTFGEVARLQCNKHAVWKPLIAVARRPSNGNIHAVVESPPQEFNVQEFKFDVFCGKRTENEMVPQKSFIRPIFKDDSYHVVTEFKDLPPEECAVKVTPKCRDAGNCSESWSDWLGMNTVTETPSPHPAVVAVPVLVGLLLVIGIAGFVWYWRPCSRREVKAAPRKSIFVISLSNSREESQTTKIKNITKAFAEYLSKLCFEATMLRADEMKNEQSLQDHLENADIVVLLCIPGRGMVAKDELFWLLELDEKLQKKSILGCLHMSSQERQSCQHFLDCRAMEDERREEAMNGSQERLLSSSFPRLTEELQNYCYPLAEKEEKEFIKFYSAIRCKAGLHTQSDAGCADGDSWEHFRQEVVRLTESPDPSDDSSASSSEGETSDDEDSGSELDKTSSAGSEDSSSVDDQCGPEHNTPGNTHHAAENGNFSGNNHSSSAQDLQHAQYGYLRPEIQSTLHCERTDYSAGGQIHRCHNHHQPGFHAPHPRCGNREPHGLTSQGPEHCASHPCCPIGMLQDHVHCSPRYQHYGQRNGHLEPEVHRPFACLGNQVVSCGNNHSCHCQFPFHQNQALCAHQRSSNGYPCSTNSMHGHHQAGMRPTYSEPCPRYPPH